MDTTSVWDIIISVLTAPDGSGLAILLVVILGIIAYFSSYRVKVLTLRDEEKDKLISEQKKTIKEQSRQIKLLEAASVTRSGWSSNPKGIRNEIYAGHESCVDSMVPSPITNGVKYVIKYLRERRSS